MREMLEGMWGFSGLMMHIWWWNARPDGYVMLYLESVLLIWQCNANCFYNLYYCVYKCFMLCLYPNFTQSYFFLIALSIYFLFIYFCIIFQMFIVIRNGLEFAHINRYSSEPRFIWNEAMYAYVMHVKRIVRLYVNIQRWLIEMQNQSF